MDYGLGQMKFVLATAFYLVLGFFFCWGILHAVRGSFWLLIAACVAYLLMFAKAGCLPSKQGH
jgi:hypothetical protein